MFISYKLGYSSSRSYSPFGMSLTVKPDCPPIEMLLHPSEAVPKEMLLHPSETAPMERFPELRLTCTSS